MEATDDEIALCRCSCGALLKVLGLPAGRTVRCPSCPSCFPKPSEGAHVEPLGGIVTTVMIRAKALLQNASLAPNSICDHCHAPTDRANGFVASREIMMRSDLSSLFPRMANVERLRSSSPEAIDSDLIEHFRKIVSADQKPWLLCEECAWIVFPSATRNALSVTAPELWEWDAMPVQMRDFFPSYKNGLPGEIL